MIVIDASALLEVLLRTPSAEAIEEIAFAPAQILCAPHLVDLEVLQVLRRFELLKEIDARRGRAALNDFAAFRLHRYPHDVLLPRVWALRANLSAYDAAYVALAEALGVPLLTHDAGIARASGVQAQIRVV